MALFIFCIFVFSPFFIFSIFYFFSFVPQALFSVFSLYFCFFPSLFSSRICIFFLYLKWPEWLGPLYWPNRALLYIYFLALQLFFFSISTDTIIYNRATYNGSNNMWTYLHSDLLTLYISIIETIYNYILNMNLYNVHPYIYLQVYTPNAYDTISLTLSFDNNITTVEQVN